MSSLDIKYFVNEENVFIYNLKGDVSNIRFNGKIDKLIINQFYSKLDLYEVECKELHYEYYHEKDEFWNIILPNSLKELYCNDMNLSNLPELLNDSLEKLICNNNKLTELHNLPITLKELDISFNDLSKIDRDLPDLVKLYCNNNLLSELPNLPDSLRELVCDFVPYLTKKPIIPEKCTLHLKNICFSFDVLIKNFDETSITYDIVGKGILESIRRNFNFSYPEKIKEATKEELLIEQIKDKVGEDDLINLHEMNRNLGNKSEDIIDLIKSDNIKYALINIYKIDENFF